jgi:hypothetical protein
MKEKFIEEKNQCGSSETTCNASYFCFDDFYRYGHADHIPRIPERFLEWFIGFFEGDGSFSYTKTSIYNRSRNEKIYAESVSSRLRFSICQKERHIIEKIAYTFGFGRVSKFTSVKKTYWRWTLDSQKAIENMAYLLLGNLVLVKRQQEFLECIEVGQKKGMFQFPFDKAKPWSSGVNLQNAWLSGFIDAEGCFYAQFSLPLALKLKVSKLPLLKKNWSEFDYEVFSEISQYKCKLKQKFHLTQKSTDETNKLFQKILCLCKGKSFHLFKKQSKTTNKFGPNQPLPLAVGHQKYVRIEFHSLSSHKVLIDYLTKYPLKTIKNVSFRRWKRVYLRRKKGVHLTSKGIKRLYRLVKAINSHSEQVYNGTYIK